MSSHFRPVFVSPTLALFVLAFAQMALAEVAESGGNVPQASNAAKAAIGAAKELIELMADRLELAESVARHKWSATLPSDDEKTDAALAEGNANALKESGVESSFADAFLKGQMAGSKEHQRQLFAAWKLAGVDGFDDVADLAAVVRPQLDKNIREQLKRLGDLKPTLCSSAMITFMNELAATVFARRALDKSLIKPLFEPFDVHAREESGSCPSLNHR